MLLKFVTTMGRGSSGAKFYAVRRGRIPGIYRSWADCEAQVKQYSAAMFKSFKTEVEAQEYLRGEGQMLPVMAAAVPRQKHATMRCAGSGSASSSQQRSSFHTYSRPEQAAGGLSNLPHFQSHASAVRGAYNDSSVSEMDISGPLPDMEIDPLALYRLEFDGGSRGNGTAHCCAGAGAVLYHHDSNVEVGSVCISLGSTTNNVAEYTGLIEGLQAAADIGVKRIRVLGDSELVVRQVNGVYKVKNEVLKELFKRLLVLRSRFSEFSIRHVYREENKVADALSNEGMDGRGWRGLRDPQGRYWRPIQVPQERGETANGARPSAALAPSTSVDDASVDSGQAGDAAKDHGASKAPAKKARVRKQGSGHAAEPPLKKTRRKKKEEETKPLELLPSL